MSGIGLGDECQGVAERVIAVAQAGTEVPERAHEGCLLSKAACCSGVASFW